VIYPIRIIVGKRCLLNIENDDDLAVIVQVLKAEANRDKPTVKDAIKNSPALTKDILQRLIDGTNIRSESSHFAKALKVEEIVEYCKKHDGTHYTG